MWGCIIRGIKTPGGKNLYICTDQQTNPDKQATLCCLVYSFLSKLTFRVRAQAFAASLWASISGPCWLSLLCLPTPLLSPGSQMGSVTFSWMLHFKSQFLCSSVHNMLTFFSFLHPFYTCIVHSHMVHIATLLVIYMSNSMFFCCDLDNTGKHREENNNCSYSKINTVNILVHVLMF